MVATTGNAEGKESIPFLGVIRVFERQSKRVTEHGRCFVEADAMLLGISLGFAPMPFEPHAVILLDAAD